MDPKLTEIIEDAERLQKKVNDFHTQAMKSGTKDQIEKARSAENGLNGWRGWDLGELQNAYS